MKEAPTEMDTEKKPSFAEVNVPHHGIKRRDQEQRVDLAGGISMDLEKDAGASEGAEHKDSRKGRDKEQGLDIGGGLFMNIEKHAVAGAAAPKASRMDLEKKDAEAGRVAEQKEADAEAKDSRKGRDKEQGLDIGGGLFIDIPIAGAAEAAPEDVKDITPILRGGGGSRGCCTCPGFPRRCLIGCCR